MWILDRFEGAFALCENEEGRTEQFPRALLPEEAREGDCLVRGSDGGFAVDTAATEARRARMHARTRELLARGRES